MLVIAKGFFPLSTCEKIWMCKLALKLDFKLVLPFQMTSNLKTTMVVQCLDFHLQFQLDVIPTTTFDLWMNRGQHDTFVFFIKFLFANWKPQYFTMIF